MNASLKTSPMAGTSSGSISQPGTSIQEFTIRVPKNMKKKHHVMRFNATLNVDFAQWRSVKMERENNLKEFKGMDEEIPKFGAGSEFNREQKEEARRKRYGIIAKKYKPEAQPWILKVGGKSGKKFRGIREGGVGENAAFYVFTHATDGAIEAYPLNEWYNFQPINRYKALSAEEAEAEFGRRKKVINYFSLMLRKRMKGDEIEPENDEEEKKAKKAAAGGGGGKKDLKISDMDEWMDSDDMSSSGDDEEEGSKPKEPDSDKDDDPKGKKKKGVVKKNKKDRDVDDEAFEESDDGDEEGREMDYDSDSSASDSELEETVTKGMQSVAEEDALKKLLTSDEDSEDEEKKDENEEDKKDEEKDKKEKENKEKDSKDKKKKKTKKKDKNGKEDDKKESSDDFSSDSSDSDNENSKSKKSKKDKDRPGSRQQASASNSRSASPSIAQLESNKRKAGANMPIADFTGSDNSNSPMSTPAKKSRMEGLPSLPKNFAGVVNVNNKDDYGITEDAVRRYLMRKPMTTTELLTKFKNKKTGVSSEKLVETMTQILKKINPVKQTIQGKMYLSIKVPK